MSKQFLRFQVCEEAENVFSENINTYIANQCVGMKVVIDPFCGAGENIIQLAKVCDLIIAIDINPAKIDLAKKNAKVYKVYHKIQFIVADFFEVCHRLPPADAIVTSPPWGGPSYSSQSSISPTNIFVDKILKLGINVAPKILLHMPKNLNLNKCISIGKQNGMRTYKVETININCKQNCKLLYFNSFKKNGKKHTNYSTINLNDSLPNPITYDGHGKLVKQITCVPIKERNICSPVQPNEAGETVNRQAIANSDNTEILYQLNKRRVESIDNSASSTSTTSNITQNSVKRPTIDDTYKYWKMRYHLFDKFYKGILLDEESFYSVCPENVSTYIAKKCVGMKVVIDPFCGAGGNVIQLAKVCDWVIAIDIDPAKIELAKNNAKVYNVYHKIQFIVADFFEVCHRLPPADAIVTSPPWGGPSYSSQSSISPTNIFVDKILKLGKKVAPKILLHLPKNLNINESISIGKQNGMRTYKVETININLKQNCKLLYFNSFTNNGKEHTNYSIMNLDKPLYVDRYISKVAYSNYLAKVEHFLDRFRQQQRELSSGCYYG